MSWLEKIRPKGPATQKKDRTQSVPEGLWTKCPKCSAPLYRPELEKNLDVCPKCDHHMRVSARNRIEMFLDQGERLEIGGDLEPQDILKFKDSKRYKDRISAAQKVSGEKDALVAFEGDLKGLPVVACAFEFNFMAGSMAAVVGEKFVQAVNCCIAERRALVCFSASGGARMNYIENLGTFSKIVIEPRINLNLRIARNLRAQLLGEFKSQTTNQVIDLEQNFLGIEKRRNC